MRREEYGGLRQETGRERYYRQISEIRETLGISHDQARQRWRDFYAPGGEAIKPVKKLTLAIRASTANKRTCPFCRDSIFHPDEGGPDYVCTSCQAHYHLDCFEEELGGSCATLGCATRRVISRARTRIRTRGRRTPVVTRDPVVERDLRQLDEDPQRVQTQRRAPVEPAREVEAENDQGTDEAENVPQQPREALWLRILELALDHPVVTISIILLGFFLTMVIANGMTG